MEDFKWTDKDKQELVDDVNKKMINMFVNRHYPISKNLSEKQKLQILTDKYKKLTSEEIEEMQTRAFVALLKDALEESGEYERLPDGKYRFIGEDA